MIKGNQTKRKEVTKLKTEKLRQVKTQSNIVHLKY